ncbi:MAG TPA: hypothetical protein VM580_31265, partial [Labilithrix sp.]|nr:hypothetical protein [Labilithrix sp.]
HLLSDRRGDALTMLYAFRQGYYARLGYATTSSRKRLALDTRSIPASWRALARSRVRGMANGQGDTLRRLHSRVAQMSSGWIERPKRFWETLFARERRMTLVCEGPSSRRGERSATGYVAFNVVQEHANAETVLEVDELIAEDAESRRALFGALAAMRDQATEIIVEVADGDPLERALVDPDGRRFGTESVPHGLGEIVAGPMVRIENVARALAARGYLERGTFDVAVPSAVPSFGEQVHTGEAWSVRIRDGRAEVGPPRGGACLRATRVGLAAIFYGGLAVTDAVALGMAEADSELAARIDATTKMPPLTPMDAF